MCDVGRAIVTGSASGMGWANTDLFDDEAADFAV